MDTEVVTKILEWINSRRVEKGHQLLEIDLACCAAAGADADRGLEGVSLVDVAADASHYVAAGISETLSSVIVVASPALSDLPDNDRAVALLVGEWSSSSVEKVLYQAATHCGITVSKSEQHNRMCVVVNLLSKHGDIIDIDGMQVESSQARIRLRKPQPVGEGDAAVVPETVPVTVLIRGGAAVTGAILLPSSFGIGAAYKGSIAHLVSAHTEGEGHEEKAGESDASSTAAEAGAAVEMVEVAVREPLPAADSAPVWQGGSASTTPGEAGSVILLLPLPTLGVGSYVLHVMGRGAAQGAAAQEGGEESKADGSTGEDMIIARLLVHYGDEHAGDSAPVEDRSGAHALDQDAPEAVSDVHVLAGGFSEVAVVFNGECGSLVPQTLPCITTPGTETVALARSLAVADTPSLPRVGHLLMVSASTLSEAQTACPDGYELVPLDLAQDISALIGAVPAEGRRASAGGGEAAGAEGEEGRSAAATPVGEGEGDAAPLRACEPPHAFLAVSRGANDPVLHSSLLVLRCEAGAGLEDGNTMPAVTPPPGYTLQMLDIAVRVPVEGGHPGEPVEAVQDGDTEGESMATPMQVQATALRMIRFVLLQTQDASAANAVANGSAHPRGVVVHAEGEDWYQGSDRVGVAESGSGEFISRDDSGYAGEEAGEQAPDEEEPDPAEIERERQELIAAIKAAEEEQAILLQERETHQAVLAAWLSMRAANADATPAGKGAVDNERSAAAAAYAAADKERRYQSAFEAFTAERSRGESERLRAEGTALALQAQVDTKDAVLGDIRASFNAFKREIARGAMHGLTGKQIPRSLLDKYEEQEIEKEDELARVQLRFLAAQGAVTKLEANLAARDKMADGLALMDFEQLKIENATLAEKIEDRSNEINKLRKKTAGAVQVLTHVREKLQFVSSEVGRLTVELAAVDTDVSARREALAAGKKQRERMRTENDRARHAQGFAYADKLAIDYERRKREVLAGKETLAKLRGDYESKNTTSSAVDAVLKMAAADILKTVGL